MNEPSEEAKRAADKENLLGETVTRAYCRGYDAATAKLREQLRVAQDFNRDMMQQDAKLAKELELFTAQHAQLCDDYEDLKVERDECCAATAKLREVAQGLLDELTNGQNVPSLSAVKKLKAALAPKQD